MECAFKAKFCGTNENCMDLVATTRGNSSSCLWFFESYVASSRVYRFDSWKNNHNLMRRTGIRLCFGEKIKVSVSSIKIWYEIRAVTSLNSKATDEEGEIDCAILLIDVFCWLLTQSLTHTNRVSKAEHLLSDTRWVNERTKVQSDRFSEEHLSRKGESTSEIT